VLVLVLAFVRREREPAAVGRHLLTDVTTPARPPAQEQEASTHAVYAPQPPSTAHRSSTDQTVTNKQHKLLPHLQNLIYTCIALPQEVGLAHANLLINHNTVAHTERILNHVHKLHCTTWSREAIMFLHVHPCLNPSVVSFDGYTSSSKQNLFTCADAAQAPRAASASHLPADPRVGRVPSPTQASVME